VAELSKLRVVLCWHMHQPYYYEQSSGTYQLPWTYLHATKDYVDMAAILESIPEARAVVNFTPTLLEQIDDYTVQINDHFDTGAPLKDPLLAALAAPVFPAQDEQRLLLIKSCLRVNRERLVEPFPVFRELVDLADCVDNHLHLASYLDDHYLADLLVWYHLVWLGETVRRKDERVRRLMKKGSGFTRRDRRGLLGIIGELLAGVVGRYRRLAEQGVVELSVTPYAHPILPLMLDFASSREALPEAPLPEAAQYPDGAGRVQWHIDEGLRVFESHFGFRPQGCWPSEGGVSEAAVTMLGEAGFTWTASGESVLRNSLDTGEEAPPPCIHRPYRIEGATPACFFRDDGLSDLIGFSYADWHAEDAVSNLLHHLQNIAEACVDEPDRVVSIILDGENAWEYYPYNGYHFLTELYRRLAEAEEIELTTFSACLEAGLQPQPLPKLVAGSWVYGTFSTWIGDAEKNRGWDLLVAAKERFDAAVAEGRLQGEALRAAERQLAVCEGSDWFWWFGDYNPAESVRDFERLYRKQLMELYRLLDEDPPARLSEVISEGGGAPQAGGVMRRGKAEP